MSGLLNQAQEHCKSAEKHLKTSLLKWKPDYDSAADEYNQAAQCFRIAGELVSSRDTYLKAAELFKKNKSFFHASKAIENAIIAGKAVSTAEEIYAMAVDSSGHYQQHGSGDSASNVLFKAAKIIEDREPNLAVKLFLQAAEVSSIENGQLQGTEYISKASRLLVKLERYDEAVDSLRREIGLQQVAGNISAVGRLTVAIVLVQLARVDAIAAEKAYKEWGANCEMPERETLEQLLQAYDEEDADSAKRALASPFIRSMDVEYARLATTIPLPKGMEVAPALRENAGPSQNIPIPITSTPVPSQQSEVPMEVDGQISEEENELC